MDANRNDPKYADAILKLLEFSHFLSAEVRLTPTNKG